MKQTSNKAFKHRLYTIIFGTNTWAGKMFDVILMICIAANVLITIFQSMVTTPWLNTLLMASEYIFTVFFTLEYVLRIYCSPRPRKYILSFFGIVDLLSILPVYLAFIFAGGRYLLVLRSFRLVRVFRVFKLFNFLNEGNLLLRSLQKSAKKILVFFLFVLILNVCLGTVMFVVESRSGNTQFGNIPNGIYWSIVTMTTVGYGDITPVTSLGRAFSACIMLLGYTIIAVPTGIVSATMVSEQKKLMRRRCPVCHKGNHEADAKYCRFCGAKLGVDEETDGNAPSSK